MEFSEIISNNDGEKKKWDLFSKIIDNNKPSILKSNNSSNLPQVSSKISQESSKKENEDILVDNKESGRKVIIYLRTSTKEQNPELQKDSCVKFCKERGLSVVEIVSEQGSAYKLEKVRPKWEYVMRRAKNENLDIVLWRYDRAFRNREEFYKFMKVMFEVYHSKIYSVTEQSIISFWEMMDKSHTDNPVFEELLKGIFSAMWDFMIKQAGEEAEEESRKKSERIKLAVRITKNGKTISYRGKKWGRKELKIASEIIKLRNEGKTMREISELVTYWDKNNHKKNVSIGYVHKILRNFTHKNFADLSVQKSTEK